MKFEDYEGHIFDCDGTITDSMPLHFLAWREAMKRFGIVFSEDRFYEMAGMPTDKIIGILAAEQGKTVDIQKAATMKEDCFIERISEVKPIPFVMDSIERAIKSGKKISVASGGTRKAVNLQLVAVGLADTFEVCVTAEDTERHKPEPDVFLKAAEWMGVEPGKCCVYEDGDLGIQAANKAGMGVVDIRKFHRPIRLKAN